MDITNVSRRLRAARVRAGLTCRELDRLAGKAQGTAAMLEKRDQVNTRDSTASAYAAVLGIEKVWLMTGAGPCLAAFQNASQEERDALTKIDPSNPLDNEKFTAHIRAAVERFHARAAPLPSAPPFIVTPDTTRNAASSPESHATDVPCPSEGVPREITIVRDEYVQDRPSITGVGV